jgi:hypothetical protein
MKWLSDHTSRLAMVACFCALALACTRAAPPRATPQPTVANAAPTPDASPPPAPPVAPAEPHGTLEEARAMLGKAVPHVKKVGPKDALFDFTARRSPFFYRDLYVVCVNEHRVVTAHGGFPTYVGSDAFFKDVDGKLLAPVFWEAAAKKKGPASVRYAIRMDETNNVTERKVAMVERVGDQVCGVVAHDE